jgi:hypothetical protein
MTKKCFLKNNPLPTVQLESNSLEDSLHIQEHEIDMLSVLEITATWMQSWM